MKQITDFLNPLNLRLVELLPFHAYTTNKYQSLDLENSLMALSAPSVERILPDLEIFKTVGLKVRIS